MTTTSAALLSVRLATGRAKELRPFRAMMFRRRINMPAKVDQLPEPLRHDCEEIFKLTDAFCAEHLDEEYGQLCRKLVAKLARKRPSPLARGDLRIWAATALYVIGGINFLFDRAQDIFMTGDQLSELTGVSKSTLNNKARQVRELLKVQHFDPEFSRRKLLVNNPIAWMVEFNGFIVDARMLPPEVQADARRRGLIPDLQEQDSE
jgi:Domain of unknown function (DUF6398)